jgi:hypothetical protein
MCFTINDRLCAKPLIAQEDIICYKDIQDTMSSEYNKFIYKFNKVYRIWFWKLKIMQDQKKEHDTRGIYRGFHSWKVRGNQRWNLIKVQCIIPKGARYYFSETQYVSNRIIIKEKV